MSIMVPAVSDLSMREREAVFGRIQRALVKALWSGPVSEDALLDRVSAETGRYVSDVRFVLSSLDIAEDAHGSLTLLSR